MLRRFVEEEEGGLFKALDDASSWEEREGGAVQVKRLSQIMIFRTVELLWSNLFFKEMSLLSK